MQNLTHTGSFNVTGILQAALHLQFSHTAKLGTVSTLLLPFSHLTGFSVLPLVLGGAQRPTVLRAPEALPRKGAG